MKYFLSLISLLFLCSISRSSPQTDIWATAYYCGYNNPHLPVDSVDCSAVTHLIHFALFPGKDGGLDSSSNGVSETYNIIPRAHAAGTKVLICVGGTRSREAFLTATAQEQTLWALANNLTRFMVNHAYDGIDIDWEPFAVSDSTQYAEFVTALRANLDRERQGYLLTAAVGYTERDGIPEMYAGLQNKLDQINLMTYDLAGPYEGWVSWLNAALYAHDAAFPGNSARPLPSADGLIRRFVAAGVAGEKLAVAIDFNGAVWGGGSGTSTGEVSAPLQRWHSPPWVTAPVPYHEIMDRYYPRGAYHWAVDASGNEMKAPFISIISPAGNYFVSYDDQRSCTAKIDYARSTGIDAAPKLGGVMIWDLSGGWRTSIQGPGTLRDSLLQAIKAGVFIHHDSAGKGMTKKATGLSTGQPEQYNLNQNFPNPFNPTTRIAYDIGQEAHVRLEIYNAAGQTVRVLVDEVQSSGNHEAQFDGGGFSSGVYFYRLTTGSFSETKRMLLVR